MSLDPDDVPDVQLDQFQDDVSCICPWCDEPVWAGHRVFGREFHHECLAEMDRFWQEEIQPENPMIH